MLVIVTVAIGGGVMWRHRAAAELREQVEHERENLKTLSRLRALQEQRTKDEMREATEKTSDAEAAIARLRGEIEQLKARAMARARTTASTPSEPAVVKSEPSMLEEMLPAAQWKNAGQATAPATLETALWASAAGDVDALTGLLSIDPVVSGKVTAIMLTLPEGIRKYYGTPERLVALMTAADVPLGAAKIYDFKTTDLRGTALSAVLRDADYTHRAVNVVLRQEGEAWKLVVPAEAVDKYAAMLKGAAGGK